MFCIIFILVALLSIHKLPGFNNVLLISGVKTSPQASPFELWANYDKILVASILLAAFYKPDLSFNIFIKMLNKNIHIILIFISMIIVLALTFGMIQFSPKIVNFLHIWIILNLVTVIAEESFFRLFFLNNLLEFANTKKLQFVALTASSIVFSAVHCCGNLYYVVLAFIASIFYGLLYINSGNRIEYSIIGHFSLNLIHILFFTYPWISIT
jgi:membrane protease YdiL (CAAX protease family)